MKTAIYIEDGVMQFVLTAETDIDKQVLKAMQDTDLKTYRGSFYNCRGGWARHKQVVPDYMHNQYERDDESLIFVLDKNKKIEVEQTRAPEHGPEVSGPQPSAVDGCKLHIAPEPYGTLYFTCPHNGAGPECPVCYHKRTMS